MKAHQLNHLFMDDIGICGCGNPEEAAKAVLSILKLCPLYNNREAFEKLVPDTGFQMLVLGQLDSADLIEHGGSVGGSWLTDKGIDVRDSLAAFSEQDFEDLFDSEKELELAQSCPTCCPSAAAPEPVAEPQDQVVGTNDMMRKNGKV